MNQDILSMTCMSQYELRWTSMYWYILAYFLNSGVFSYRLVLFWIRGGTRRYKAVKLVQWGTRQYQKVLYPWIWRYKAVQGLVPSCTSLYLHIQGYGTFWYCLLPPGTASYPEEDRAVWEKPEFTKMLVCTSTYLYILVHTDSYQSCKSRPIHTLVLVCTSTYQYR